MGNIKYYQTIPEAGIKGSYNTGDIGLPDLTGWSVMDIGCNTGAYLLECKKRGADKLTGVEINDTWRRLAIGIFQELNIDCKFYKDIQEKSDLVLLLSVLHLVDNPQWLLNKAWENTNKLLIVEINDRLQKIPIKLPDNATLYGKNKDNRSVYRIFKNDSQ